MPTSNAPEARTGQAVVGRFLALMTGQRLALHACASRLQSYLRSSHATSPKKSNREGLTPCGFGLASREPNPIWFTNFKLLGGRAGSLIPRRPPPPLFFRLRYRIDMEEFLRQFPRV